jgi:hypothetical protein
MTPKEKADQLVSRYRKEILKGKYRIDGFVIEELAEECALIAVDEIIKNGGTKYIIEYKPNSYTNEVWYWEEVKEEIEKL